MRKILIFIFFILFIMNREVVLLSGLEALQIWSKSLFPLLFSTFIMSDLLLFSGIGTLIIRWFGNLYQKIFHLHPAGVYIFFLSLIAGTPTNAKNIYNLYTSHTIEKEEMIPILSMCIFFNPLFILTVSNLRILLILVAANFLTGIFLRRKDYVFHNHIPEIHYPFSLNQSIETNIHILLNVLGTVTFFLTLSNLLPIQNIFFKTLFSGILEVTTGINKINLFYKATSFYEYFVLLLCSFGGLSILTQIKSIFKDTSVSYRHFYKSRLICACIAIVICFITHTITA